MTSRIRESKDRFIERSLQVIPVDEKSNIEKWYSECFGSGCASSGDALRLLNAESKQSKKGRMAFICSCILQKRVPGLTSAECTAVTMYTLDHPANYYEEFNKDCRNGEWEKYKIFSALLFSACMKLAKIDPVKSNEVLYRGLGTSLKPPSKEFFWGQFLSTTSSSDTANTFGQKTKIAISHCRYGARISKLSAFEGEQEVSHFTIRSICLQIDTRINSNV